MLLDSKDELAGLPEDYIAKHAPEKDGKIRITTDYPDYVPFMTFAKNDARRLELYRMFRNRAWPKNESVLLRVLGLRHELAGLLGHDDWADFVTGDKMIRSAEAAQVFVDKVAVLAKPRADADYKELLARLLKEEPDAKFVGDWQKTAISEFLTSRNV